MENIRLGEYRSVLYCDIVYKYKITITKHFENIIILTLAF